MESDGKNENFPKWFTSKIRFGSDTFERQIINTAWKYVEWNKESWIFFLVEVARTNESFLDAKASLPLSEESPLPTSF